MRARDCPARVTAGLRVANAWVGPERRAPSSGRPEAGVLPQGGQGATCNVLDLVLGPLHVNLLGLLVDLNRVHLTITATPGGGILGNLFCGLANTPI
jgi:hypothetical protein